MSLDVVNLLSVSVGCTEHRTFDRVVIVAIFDDLSLIPAHYLSIKRIMKIFRKLDMLSSARALADWVARSPRRTFVFIFLLSFAVRGYQLAQIHPRYVIPSARWELGSIAISLMQTGQLANPYMIPTGPTAHLPPVYPAIFSMIYRLFGLTSTAGYLSLLFIIATGSVLYAMLPWFSDKLGIGRGAGIIGGLAGALFVEWPGHGEYPTALVLGLLLVTFVRRWTGKCSSWVGSFLLGLAIGAVFHLQPALLPVMLGCVAFELCWSQKVRKWAVLGVMTLGVVLACLPWAWRNYTTFNAVFFIRSNLGLELRMGNHEGAAAAMEVMDAQQEPIHPRTHFAEARKVRDWGEVEYMRQAKREALEWIRTHPADFLWLTVQRVAYFWAGPLHRPLAASGVLGLTILAFGGAWQTMPSLSIPQRAAILIPLATYPLIYYVVPYMARYRVPIDWILFILAGAAVGHRVWRR